MNFNQSLTGESQAGGLGDLTKILKNAISRYWRIALSPALVLLGLVAVLSLRIPDYFSSESLVYIQPRRVTSSLFEQKGTESKDEMRDQLEALRGEILSRPRLRAVLQKHNVYPNLDTPKGLERAVDKFRLAIKILPVETSMGGTAFQMFRLEFTHRDANVAFEVTRALSDLFVEESLVSRRSEIRSTEEFLEAQLDEARKKLEVTEAAVQQFIRLNFGKLPDHLNAAIARLENAQAQLTTNSQLQAALQTRKQALHTEMKELARTSGSLGDGEAASSDPQENLAQLESALVILQSRYSERHPDVMNTKKRIAALKQEVATGKRSGPAQGSSSNPRISRGDRGYAIGLRRDLGEIDAQLVRIEKENEDLKKSVATLQTNLEAMPIKEQEMLKIRRDYANVRENYDRLLAAREEAALESSLVRSHKAPQFRIIEPAERALAPAGPNRGLIFAAGALLSLIVFFAIPMALYFLNNSFKFTDDLENEVGVPVIGVVPPMITPESVRFRRRLSSSALVASLLSLVGGFVIIFLTT